MPARRFSPPVWLAFAVLAGASIASCATYQDELLRGQRAFEQSEHERALAIFRALEPDTLRLPTVERAQYAYLRGMTDFRIGYRAEARHWLAIALALDDKTPGSLPPDWEKRLSESLKDLNEEVYAGGMADVPGGEGAGGGEGARGGEAAGDDKAAGGDNVDAEAPQAP